MKSTSTLLRPAALLVGVSTASAAALALSAKLGTDYAPERTFQVSFSQESSSESSSEAFLNGEPMERGGMGGERTSSGAFAFTTLDTVLEAKDGAPTKVSRLFEDVSASRTFQMRDEPMEMEGESAFEGITLILTKKGDELEVGVGEGDTAPEEERLEGHSMTLVLDRLLPDEAVEAGDEWSVEGEDLLAAMGHGLQEVLIDRPEPQDEGGGGRGGRGRGGMGRGMMARGATGMLAGGEWDVTLKMTEETEDVDGVTCAVIEIEAEVEGDAPAFGGRGGRGRDRMVGQEGRGGGGTQEASYTGKFEGQLLWSVEGKHPVRLTLEGTTEMNSESERETERGVFEMSSRTETTLKVTVEVTAGSAKK